MDADVTEFKIGDMVAFKGNPSGEVGIVVCISYFPGAVMYNVSWGLDGNTSHYGFELTPYIAYSHA